MEATSEIHFVWVLNLLSSSRTLAAPSQICVVTQFGPFI